jgi:hypothetical protein
MQRHVSAAGAAPVVAAAIVVLIVVLTACTPGSTAAANSGPASPRPATSSHPARSPAGAPSTRTKPGTIPAAARRVTCPAGLLGTDLASSQHPPAEQVPPSFQPVAVVECTLVATSRSRGKLTLTIQRRVAVTGLDELVTALREPPPQPPAGTFRVCPAIVYVLPWIGLVGAGGQVIHPLVPTGPCGQPVADVISRLAALHWISLGNQSVESPRPPIQGAPVRQITPGTPMTAP